MTRADTTQERIYVCTTCGGEARYVGQTPRETLKRICETCRRQKLDVYRSERARQIKMSRSEVEVLQTRRFPKKHVAVDLTGPLPVVWIDQHGKKHLIRGIDTRLLTSLVFHAIIVNKQLLAICRELRTRKIGGATRAQITRLDPPPCRCGKIGSYIVGMDTYCIDCFPRAKARRESEGKKRDERKTVADTFFQEQQLTGDRARQHHDNMKRRRKK